MCEREIALGQLGALSTHPSIVPTCSALLSEVVGECGHLGEVVVVAGGLLPLEGPRHVLRWRTKFSTSENFNTIQRVPLACPGIGAVAAITVYQHAVPIWKGCHQNWNCWNIFLINLINNLTHVFTKLSSLQRCNVACVTCIETYGSKRRSGSMSIQFISVAPGAPGEHGVR